MEFAFLSPGPLVNGDLTLALEQTVLDDSGEETLPTYRFRMIHTGSGADVGFINLRVGHGDNLVLYRGHIGYGVASEWRSHGYAARACALLLPLARLHNIAPLWITCNPDNVASRKTCERLGARLIQVLPVPPETEAYRAGARVKCRYRLDP